MVTHIQSGHGYPDDMLTLEELPLEHFWLSFNPVLLTHPNQGEEAV